MYIITLLLIYSDVAVNSLTEAAEKAANAVADTEGAVANRIENFEKATHLGTSGKANKASVTSYKAAQALEHDISWVGLSLPVKPEVLATLNELKKKYPNIINHKLNSKYIEDLKVFNSRLFYTNRGPDPEYLRIMTLRNILKMQNGEPLDRDYMQAMKLRNARKAQNFEAPDELYLVLCDYNYNMQSNKFIYVNKVTKKKHTNKDLHSEKLIDSVADVMNAVKKKQITNEATDIGNAVKETPLINGATNVGNAVKNTQATNEAKNAVNVIGKKQVKKRVTNIAKIVKKIQLIKGKKRMVKAAGLGILGTVVTGTIVGTIATKNYLEKSKLKSNLSSGGLVLTPGNATSSILSNDAPAHNTGTPSGNNKTPSTATLPGTPEATQVHKGSDSVTKHSRLNTKRAHRSKQTTTVYIVVIVATVLVLIVAGVFVLKMQHVKPKKADLFTDMNQYYANDLTKANSIMHTIYPNASLKQRKM